MAWRRSRGSSRRSTFRRSSPSSLSVRKVTRFWNEIVTLENVGTNIWRTLDLFSLVEPVDYSENWPGTQLKKDKALFLRSRGRVTYDLLTIPNNSVGCVWRCAVIKEGQENLENIFLADKFDLDIVDENNAGAGVDDNLTRLNVIWQSVYTGYTSGFEELPGGGGKQRSQGLSTNESRTFFCQDFRTRMKRKLQVDEGIWMLVVGYVNGVAEEVGVNVSVDAQSWIREA